MIGREEILRQLRKVQLIITAETELQVYAAGGLYSGRTLRPAGKGRGPDSTGRMH